VSIGIKPHSLTVDGLVIACGHLTVVANDPQLEAQKVKLFCGRAVPAIARGVVAGAAKDVRDLPPSADRVLDDVFEGLILRREFDSTEGARWAAQMLTCPGSRFRSIQSMLSHWSMGMNIPEPAVYSDCTSSSEWRWSFAMKFSVPVICPSCKSQFAASGVREERIPAAACPNCGDVIHIIDPLSLSIVAERLLYRSHTELTAGDYTFSIISSAIAVEAAFTQAFMKWKSIDYQQTTGNQPTDEVEQVWEEEYRNETRGSFKTAAKFVAKFLFGKTFDQFASDFLACNTPAELIHAAFPPNKDHLNSDYIYKELFHCRNMIMHRGKVDYLESDASVALEAARTAFAILKAMDKERCEAMERAWRSQVEQR
jgi:hypothetical protein